MLFRNRFTSLCNLIFSCFTFADESDDSNESSTAWELPDSIIHEILLKLPIETVIRCRGVCKDWYRLIQDPFFANTYFKSSTFNAIAICQHWNEREDWNDEFFFSYVEIGRNGEPVSLKPETCLKLSTTEKKTRWKNLIGSCDGMLCLFETPIEDYYSTVTRQICNSDIDTTVCIVNPLIGEYMILPKVRAGCSAHVVYGFGLTIDGDSYKVVRVGMKCYGHLETQIVTIGVDKNWREVKNCSRTLSWYYNGSEYNWELHCENCVSSLRLYSHGVALHGALHWVGDGGNVDTGCSVIYAFDLLKETEQCFKLPFAIGRKASGFYLGAWNGNLCITDNNDKFQVDLWTMKQYGVVGSWSKDIVIKTSVRRLYFGNLVPITTMRNGNLMISCPCNGKLFSFDPKTKNCVELGIDTNGSPMRSIGCSYTPSFISPQDILSRQITISG